jgi:hypothetical protein
MARYEVYLHFDLLESVPARGEQRRRIMDFVRSLADQPNSSGDYTDSAESQRTRQIKIVGKYAVTYWVRAAAQRWKNARAMA